MHGQPVGHFRRLIVDHAGSAHNGPALGHFRVTGTYSVRPPPASFGRISAWNHTFNSPKADFFLGLGIFFGGVIIYFWYSDLPHHTTFLLVIWYEEHESGLWLNMRDGKCKSFLCVSKPWFSQITVICFQVLFSPIKPKHIFRVRPSHPVRACTPKLLQGQGPVATWTPTTISVLRSRQQPNHPLRVEEAKKGPLPTSNIIK